jgi:hypothetical protein
MADNGYPPGKAKNRWRLTNSRSEIAVDQVAPARGWVATPSSGSPSGLRRGSLKPAHAHAPGLGVARASPGTCFAVRERYQQAARKEQVQATAVALRGRRIAYACAGYLSVLDRMATPLLE